MSTFIIARKGARNPGEPLDFVVFHAGANDEEEAVALFTSRGQAEIYLRSADWDDEEEVVELKPGDLGHWLVDVIAAGVRFLAVNPSRRRQRRGRQQPVVDLEAQLEQVGLLLAKNAETDGSIPPIFGRELEVYHCRQCGRIVMEPQGSGRPRCCSREMVLLTSDAAPSGQRN